jgi:hypothetical protein
MKMACEHARSALGGTGARFGSENASEPPPGRGKGHSGAGRVPGGRMAFRYEAIVRTLRWWHCFFPS